MSTTHHEFSPSRLFRLILCAGSWRLSRLAPPRPPGTAALEGTKIHMLIEQAIRARLAGTPWKPGEPVNEHDLELVSRALEFFDDQCERLAVTHAVNVTDDTNFAAEQRLEVVDEKKDVVTFGTLDFLILKPPAAVVIDWKAGWATPDSRGLVVQLACYAAGVLCTYPGVEEVVTHAYHLRSQEVFSRRFRRAHLSGIISKIKEVIASAKAGPMVLTPSASACEYCPALPVCPAAIHQALEVGGQVAERKAPDFGLPLMAPAEVADLKDRVQYAFGVLEQVKEAVNEDIKRRGGVPGWRLRRQQGRRHISDPVGAFRLADLPPEKFMAAVSVSPSDLEEAWVTHYVGVYPDMTKKALSEQFSQLMDPAITRGPEVISVVRDRKESKHGENADA